MALKMTIDFSKEMDFGADFDTCFALFSSVPETARHFPRVESLTEIGDGRYRWEMKKVGLSKYNVQVIYACKYENDPKAGVIRWTPVDGVGNGRNTGEARLTDKGGRTHVSFSTSLELELPIPSLAKALVKPLVVKEFNKTADEFEQNLLKHFGG